jgi:transposase
MDNNVRKTKVYSEEFKFEAIKLVELGSRSIAQIARELEVTPQTLHTWVRRSKLNENGQRRELRPDELEIKRLRKENEELRMEKEILKRFSAFWIKETGGK